MTGFTNLRIPLSARRAITMLPALIILATGTNATSALVLSQVVLSFGIPFALVPLVVLTSRSSVMRRHVNRRRTVICAIACVAVIIALNALILFQQFAAA
jgi:manganese transport protein